jgi:uncharacterized membrane protein YhaH (DUF805 family)
MGWKHLFLSGQGRVDRTHYWICVILLLIGLLIFRALDQAIGTYSYEHRVGLLSGLYSLAAIYPSIMLYTKRWHDRGKSGWWTLIMLVPVIGPLWFFVEQGFLSGTYGQNQFGPYLDI